MNGWGQGRRLLPVPGFSYGAKGSGREHVYFVNIGMRGGDDICVSSEISTGKDSPKKSAAAPPCMCSISDFQQQRLLTYFSHESILMPTIEITVLGLYFKCVHDPAVGTGVDKFDIGHAIEVKELDVAVSVWSIC